MCRYREPRAWRTHATYILAGLLIGAAGPARAKQMPAPLFEGIGDLHHPVTTRSELAQRYFNQGLTIVFGFNHRESMRSFQAAAQADPECAMAYWGIAYANGPHVNAPMFDDQVAAAWDALQRAIALKPKVNQRERDYIDALATRYTEHPVEDRTPYDLAYANAMRELHRKYPDDLDAAVLFAEALMDTMPWDYWTKDLKPKPATVEAIAALESVIARNPDHPGANHFYIHAVEAGPRPQDGIPAADRLATFSSTLGHLVHMPSHIYVRVGEYAKASEVNVLASMADERYIAACRAQGFYPGVYYPHNVHFLWYSRTFEGRSADAIAAAMKVAEYAALELCGTPKVEAVRQRHVPLLAFARFGRWDDILAAPSPEKEFPFDVMMWHYARATAYAAKGDITAAEAEARKFRTLADSPEVKALDSPYFPGTAIVAVARAVVDARVATAKGNHAAAIVALERAVQAEDEIPYMEPAFWYYPTRQSLAVAYLRAGRLAEAEATFREDLQRNPRNGWSLHGLAATLRAQGNEDAAVRVDAEYARAWRNADVKPDLAWY